MFIGDATINIYPDARTLAEIAIQTLNDINKETLKRVVNISCSLYSFVLGLRIGCTTLKQIVDLKLNYNIF